MARCENDHDVPEGQAFCGKCGGAAKGDDPRESEDDLAGESGPASSTDEVDHSAEPEEVEALPDGDFEHLIGSSTTVEGNVGEKDDDAKAGIGLAILGWVQAPEHGLIAVLGLVAIVVLIVVGLAVATSGGGDSSSSAEPPPTDAPNPEFVQCESVLTESLTNALAAMEASYSAPAGSGGGSYGGWSVYPARVFGVQSPEYRVFGEVLEVATRQAFPSNYEDALATGQASISSECLILHR